MHASSCTDRDSETRSNVFFPNPATYLSYYLLLLPLLVMDLVQMMTITSRLDLLGAALGFRQSFGHLRRAPAPSKP